MAVLPLNINGQIVDINQLTGFNYVQGYPELINLLWRHCQNPSFGYTMQGTLIYPLPGKQRIKALPGRAWGTGTRLQATRFGNTEDRRVIQVHSYDKYSGEALIEILGARTVADSFAVRTGYYLRPYFYEYLGPTAGVASGGTGGTSIQEARKGLKIAHPSDYLELIADFDFPSPYVVAGLGTASSTVRPEVGSAVLPNGYLPASYNNAPGLYFLPKSDASALTFSGPNFGLTNMAGTDTAFECAFYLSTLAPFGQYTLNIGFGLDHPEDHYLKLTYSGNQSSGRFVLRRRYGEAFESTSVTSVTAELNKRYVVRFFRPTGVTSNIIEVSINGKVEAAVPLGTGADTLVSPQTAVSPSIFVSGNVQEVCAVDYLYFRKHFQGGR